MTTLSQTSTAKFINKASDRCEREKSMAKKAQPAIHVNTLSMKYSEHAQAHTLSAQNTLRIFQHWQHNDTVIDLQMRM